MIGHFNRGTEMKRIAVLTSGGDAPGMNAAIRAIVKNGIDEGSAIFGVRHGYNGLIEGNFFPLGIREVDGIIQQGGTLLGSIRSPEFETKKGRLKALQALHDHNIEGLIIIGGNGSQMGAHALSEMGFPIVGVASTIDNDIFGVDITIGVDTALNIALEAIDRLKVTASAYQRVFLVEVMGRNCGYLALMSGLAGDAEAVVLPEVETDPDILAADLRAAYERGKSHAIVVVAEGARYNAAALKQHFLEHHDQLGFELRMTTLGHVQRGGSPTAFDRLLATRLATEGIHRLLKGEQGILIGWKKGEVHVFPYTEIVRKQKELDLNLLKLVHILAK